MDPDYVLLKVAVKETRKSYFWVWRKVISKEVAAMKVRRKGGRRIVWLVNLPQLKTVLAQQHTEPAYEILEKIKPR
ncbi:MAG: hypothetical protein WCG32_05190 [Actinomycetes bacterium]